MSESSSVLNRALLRRLAYAGARYGPRPWVKYSPPLFGLAFSGMLPAYRRAVLDNLRKIYGPRPAPLEAVDVARTFASYASCLAEALAVGRGELRDATPRVRGGAELHQLLQRGGLLFVTAHVGPWDAAAHLLRRDLKAEVMVVMAREPDEKARSLHDSVRADAGVRVLHVGEHPLEALPLLRHLRQGGVVAAQLDRPGSSAKVVEVQLFDAPFAVPEGPFSLAALAQVPVVPLFARRIGFFDYELTAGKPIRLSRRPSPKDLRAAAQSASEEMERFIRANPTQWFHFLTPAIRPKLGLSPTA